MGWRDFLKRLRGKTISYSVRGERIDVARDIPREQALRIAMYIDVIQVLDAACAEYLRVHQQARKAARDNMSAVGDDSIAGNMVARMNLVHARKDFEELLDAFGPELASLTKGDAVDATRLIELGKRALADANKALPLHLVK